jgi:hypothetical protein
MAVHMKRFSSGCWEGIDKITRSTTQSCNSTRMRKIPSYCAESFQHSTKSSSGQLPMSKRSAMR